ncbi:MAG: STAS domain-containing protein [Terriglobales bacterium]
MIKVICRRIDSVTVVDLGGRITLGDGAAALRETIRELLAKGEDQILLNLADVNYIDSSGLGEMVSGFSQVRKAGGDLKLLSLTHKVHDLLQITKLYTVFDVHDDEARAIAAFGSEAAPAGASGAPH